MSIVDIIGHYQRSIEKSTNDESRLIHCIDKLYNLPVTVHHLQETGIGKTVNSLRKYDGEVGIAAKALVAKWKAMVAAEEIVEEDIRKKSPDDDPPRKHHERSNVKDEDKKNDYKTNDSSSREPKTRKIESNGRETHKHSSSRHKSDSNENKSEADKRHKKSSINGTHKSSSHNSSRSSNDKSSCNGDSSFDTLSQINTEKLDEEIANLMVEPRNSSRESSHSKKSKRDREKERDSSRHSSKSHREKDNSDHKSHKKHKDHHSESDEKSKKHKRKESETSQQNDVPAKKKNKVVYDGIDSSMGTSFEEALGMMTSTSSVKNLPKSKPRVNEASSSSSFVQPIAKDTSSNTPSLLTSNIKLKPLDPAIALELPTISPNYKPMPLNPTVMDCVFSKNDKPKRYMTDEEALCAGISSKTMRTKIYSGVKSGVNLQVPRLYDLCIRVLQKNIDALEYTGGVPYEVLRNVLERATPQQLLIFEDFNPYLMEDSDELWKLHCKRHYKAEKRQEFETWREMFLRCKEEQEERLTNLAEKVKIQNQQKIPIRRTQLAYVDSTVKPPRNVQRKQEQFGTKGKMIATPAARVATLSNMAPTITRPGDARLRVGPDVRDHAQATSSFMRPKKAPLMQKTLQLMKGRFKR